MLIRLFGKRKSIIAVAALAVVLSFLNAAQKTRARVSTEALTKIFVVENRGLTETLLKLEALSSSKTQKSRNVKRISAEWESIDGWIASTPERRLQAAKALGIAEDEWAVILLSIDCDACNELALEINVGSQGENCEMLGRIAAVTVDPSDKTTAWSKSLGLKYRVESVSESLFENLGNPVILPTIVKYRDGEAVEASGSAEVIKRCR